MQRATASVSAFLGLSGPPGVALGSGPGSGEMQESKRYIALPMASPERRPRPSSSSSRGSDVGSPTRRSMSPDVELGSAPTRVLHPQASRRRIRFLMAVGGATAAVILLGGAASHTDALDYLPSTGRLGAPGVYPTTEWEGLPEDRPEQWGWTEEMGWLEDQSSRYLGDIAESRYRLGFEKGLEGTEWYIKHLETFAASLPAPLAQPLLSNLRSHFYSYYASSGSSLYPTSRVRSESVDASSSPSASPSQTSDSPDAPPSPSQDYVLPGPMIEYKNIFQTDKEAAPDATKKWTRKNARDGWAVDFYDDDRAQEWVEDNFKGSDVEWAWDFMQRGVLKADFLRYMLPLVKGGVYVDVDTKPVRPIEEWGTHSVEYLDLSFTDGPLWRSSLSERPAVVVGVDVDVHSLPTWHQEWPRPLGICQWALSSAPHHPIMLDAVRRVVNATRVVDDWRKERDATVEQLRKEGKMRDAKEVEGWQDVRAMGVMEWTGPGLFSDAVTGYLLARYGVTWHRLRNLDHPLRIGDVLILPITAFSPGGEPDFGSRSSKDRQSALVHSFRGSWKGKGPR